MVKFGKLILVMLSLLLNCTLIVGCGSNSSSSTISENTGNTVDETTSITWASYNGSVLPDTNTPAFTLTDSTGISTTTLNGDGTVRFDTTSGSTASTAKAYWTINNFFTSTPSKLTLLFRMKYNSTGASTATRAAEVDLHAGYNGNSGARTKLIIRSNTDSTATVQIEKYDGTNYANDKTIDTSSYHIYQVTYDINGTTANVSVYVDGALIFTDYNNGVIPISLTSTNNYLLIGDGGSSAYCCDIDWIIWTFDGVYTPSQLIGKLPSGLGDTTGY